MCTVVHARALTYRQSSTLIKRFFFQVERTARLLFLWKMEVWLFLNYISRYTFCSLMISWTEKNYVYRYSVCTNPKEVKQRLSQSCSAKKVAFLFFLQAFEKKTEVEKIRGRNRKLVDNILPEHVADYFLQHQSKDETVYILLTLNLKFCRKFEGRLSPQTFPKHWQKLLSTNQV